MFSHAQTSVIATLIVLLTSGLAPASAATNTSSTITLYLPFGEAEPLSSDAPTEDDITGLRSTIIERSDQPFARKTTTLLAPLALRSFQLHLEDRDALNGAQPHTTLVVLLVERPDGTLVQNPDGSAYRLGEALATVDGSTAASGEAAAGWSDFSFDANLNSPLPLHEGAAVIVPAGHRIQLMFTLVSSEGGIVTPIADENGDPQTLGEVYAAMIHAVSDQIAGSSPAAVDEIGEDMGFGSISEYVADHVVRPNAATGRNIDALTQFVSLPASTFRTGAVDASSWITLDTA